MSLFLTCLIMSLFLACMIIPLFLACLIMSLFLACLIMSSVFHSHSNDNINMKEREMKSLKRQLDGTSEDLNETSRGKEVALRENRRLQDDLAVMTRENQVRNETWQEMSEGI